VGQFAAPAPGRLCVCRGGAAAGQCHEVGPFFKLVEQFVQTAGKGVIKWLVLDRGFIDGERLSRCQQTGGSRWSFR